MNRRHFIKQATKAVALAAVTGGAGGFFHNREVARALDLASASRDFTVKADLTLPSVVLARNEDNITALQASLDAIGGIKRFVKPGEKVTIKPNVGWDRTSAQAATTNPHLVGEMVRTCLAAGASEVVISDITCNDPRRCFLRSGIREAAEAAGARVLLPEDDDYVTADLGGKLLTQWPVLRHFIECDRFINMPIVKHHSLTDCTIGMKNLYGIIGGRRNRLHQQIDQSIVDLASFCPPTLIVIDATRVLLRNGPQGGSLDDVRIDNTVICATDQVAGDSRAARLLGHEPGRVSHMALAEAAGLGQVDFNAVGYKEITV